MIKKLRNQPYAPKVGTSPQVGTRGSKKNLYDRSKIRGVFIRLDFHATRGATESIQSTN
jgi:hypothetical protein